MKKTNNRKTPPSGLVDPNNHQQVGGLKLAWQVDRDVIVDAALRLMPTPKLEDVHKLALQLQKEKDARQRR